jgi:CBS domain-containing protein
MPRTTVSTVMSRDPVYVPPEATVRSASSLVAQQKSNHLIVSDNGNIVGILCTCDLERARGDTLVSQCMRAPVVTVQGGTLVDDAAELMREKSVGSLPVLAGNLVLGIVTRSDLVRAGVPGASIGTACATCGSEQHRRSETPFCAECLECAHDPADLGEGD